jgi:hypothetical protein
MNSFFNNFGFSKINKVILDFIYLLLRIIYIYIKKLPNYLNNNSSFKHQYNIDFYNIISQTFLSNNINITIKGNYDIDKGVYKCKHNINHPYSCSENVCCLESISTKEAIIAIIGHKSGFCDVFSIMKLINYLRYTGINTKTNIDYSFYGHMQLNLVNKFIKNIISFIIRYNLVRQLKCIEQNRTNTHSENENDEEKPAHNSYSQLLTNYNFHKLLSLFIFCEGGYYEEDDIHDLYSGAFRLACDSQKIVIPIILKYPYICWEYESIIPYEQVELDIIIGTEININYNSEKNFVLSDSDNHIFFTGAIKDVKEFLKNEFQKIYIRD